MSIIASHSPLNISKKAGDISKGLPIGNGLWGIEWLRDQRPHVTLKGQGYDPNTSVRALFVPIN